MPPTRPGRLPFGGVDAADPIPSPHPWPRALAPERAEEIQRRCVAAPNSPNGPNLGGPMAAVGIGLLMVACCAGPVLLAAGGLSVLGAALHRPWLLVAAALVVLAAAGLTVRRMARRDRGGGGGDPSAA